MSARSMIQARAIRGAALVLVLWLIALLTALIGAFALTARTEGLQGKVLGDGAEAQERARAGLEYALTRLAGTATQPGWRADGRRYRWQYEGATVDLRITDETGKVDLNMADAPLLAALVRAVGEDPQRAERIAAAIVDWRDPDNLTQPNGAEDPDYAAAGLPYGAKDAPFESLAELQLVLGMDPALYAKLLPNLTLYAGVSRPMPDFAPAPVLTALGLDAQQVLAQRERSDQAPGMLGRGGGGIYSIESRVRLDNGREGGLRAVVRPGSSALPGSAYTVLRWEEGSTVR